MTVDHGVIAGGGAPIPPPASGGGGILPSVVFPPSVILPPCANAGVIIDISPADVTAATTKAATATNIVARIFPFMFKVIVKGKTTNYIIVVHIPILNC
jgi:hypothetical protein